MVVGALIYLLGIELMREALYDTWGRVNRFEYFVIVAIILAMGVWDFVYGIIIGIILACGSFVVESSQKSAIKATYSGAVARSTVRRHPFQQRFLKEVGDEILVVKLSGFLFFGTIVSVEKKIRELLDAHNEQSQNVKYLVIDFQGVSGLDFSAAEAFTRMHRLMDSRRIELILCALSDEASNGLQAVGLWETNDPDNDIHIFSDLNSALEWSENQLLAVYYQVREQQKIASIQSSSSHSEGKKKPSSFIDDMHEVEHLRLNSALSEHLIASSSPRQTHIHRASSSAMLADPTFAYDLQVAPEAVGSTASSSETQASDDHHTASPPLTLFYQIVSDLTGEPTSFWTSFCELFVREEHKAGTYLYHRSEDSDGFYLVEKGVLKAEYILDQGKFTEAIVAGTTAGELPFFSETKRSASMLVEREAIVWRLSSDAWRKFICHDSSSDKTDLETRQKIALEFYKVAMKLTAERFSAITAYVLTSAS